MPISIYNFHLPISPGQFVRNAPADQWIILLPALILITLIVLGIALQIIRRMRLQKARAELLSHNLQQMRDENRRRLNFLNALSHDLRTPLNGITLQTHVVESAIQTSDHDTVLHAVDVIRSSSGLAGKILDALLKYARVDLDSNIISVVPLNDLLHQTADPFLAAAQKKRLAFVFSVPPGLTLSTDRDKLQNIIANLLDNAVKFTFQGTITLRAGRTEIDAADSSRELAPLAFHSRSIAGIFIEVTDTGEGIAPAHIDKLFREFFQAHNPARNAQLGLGLGLVVAQRLAQQLGGCLQCESKPREGTTFRLALPLSAPLPMKEEPSPSK